MDKTEQILAGVTEPHSTADTGFVIRSASGHIEGNHALVLVPDIYHAIHFPGVRGNMISGTEALSSNGEAQEKHLVPDQDYDSVTKRAWAGFC